MKSQFCTVDELKADERYSCVGGPFGSNLTQRDYRDDGVPVIRGANLPGDQEFLDDNFVFVSDQKADSLAANTAYPGDLVFTQRGTLGQIGIIPSNARFPRYIISQSQMKLTVDTKTANPKYVYYYFRQKHVVAMLQRLAITSGVPHINLGILKGIGVQLNGRAAQDRIVAILDNYNRTISINNRRIQLLDAWARQLFQEWFVRLRYPGHTNDGTVDGVPERWERLPLEEAFILQRGFDLPDQSRIGGEVPIYGSTGVVGYHNEAMVSAPGVVTGRSGTLGDVHFVRENFWPLNTALWVKAFRRVSPLYALLLLKTLDLKQYNGGVSVPTLDRKSVHRIAILIPPRELIVKFDDIVTSAFNQIGTLSIQNEKLRRARDLLLPRLMDSRIEV